MNDIGLIGLGVMGSNLALNIADHGYKISVYNYTPDLVEKFTKENSHENAFAFTDLKEFVSSLSLPRKIMIMVTAGAAVDSCIKALVPLLNAGDIIMDMGNSNYQDSRRRTEELSKLNIDFMGIGVSGGAAGARNGPAIMPGGTADDYSKVGHILEAISAKAYDGAPCCAHMGTDGAGHYVKMVHNGIEYADMQLIAETYLLLKNLGGLDNQEIAKIFNQYNQGKLKSYLIEIAADVLAQKNPLGEGELIDYITDSAGQKGTGKWTAISAIEQGVDLSMIDAACNARFTSSHLNERLERAQREDKIPTCGKVNIEDLAKTMEDCLYLCKIAAYAQGFVHYKDASDTYGWNLDLGKIAKIFRGGCIIQARFLDTITKAYEENNQLVNLMDAPFFREQIKLCINSARKVLVAAVSAGIPVPALSAAISYIDAMNSECVGANMIQGLRDYFGAHTFIYKGQSSAMHHEWKKMF
ncbi:MAG: NADP-dependent phosphogluconate dehydrogenase [Succinatimonas sp.]|nr:NADP-dependent phosphogluconate dehydrogenase [Succinatimonas sp.]